MAFAIMRCEKLKSFGSFGGAVQHCFRERNTPNADETRTADNVHYYARNEAQAFKALREKLPEKIRKNGVICIEYVFTASPEFFATADEKKQGEFFKRSVEWLKDKYGEDNIVIATVHNDEKTPHMSAFVVPIDARGKLNAAGLIGNREQMSRDQDTFHARVADLGLERGLKGSKAQHMTIQQYYGSLNKASETPKITPEDVTPQGGFFHKEKPEEVAERLNQRLEQETRPIRSKAAEYEREKQRRQAVEKRLQQAEKELKCQQDQNSNLQEIKELLTVLTPEDLKQIQAQIQKRKAEKQREQELRQQMQKSMAESFGKLDKSIALMEQKRKAQAQKQLKPRNTKDFER